ncbi:MAG: tRNA 2-thiouridine(34) synthase MnmA [Anaerolineales bacterium]|nr:tRNA 2-thiouridine(34) synthase MnmA [Anaerolineales bacterium]
MKPKAAVGLSGGVDSAVAAALLLDRGYDVFGVFALQTPSPDLHLSDEQIWDLAEPAARVAEALHIPLEILDYRETFRSVVLDYFLDSYLDGQTPNPCVVCNRTLRWQILFLQIREMGADFFATGHYARLSQQQDSGILMRGVDRTKDQSYFLSMIPREQFHNTLFPIGDKTKPEVRKIAAAMNLPAADRSDSQDLCFIAHGDYRQFITDHIPASVSKGPILNSLGEYLGEHQGLAMYTIGQRKGIGISAAEPFYVIGKDPSLNILYIGSHEDRYRKVLTITDLVLHVPPGIGEHDWTVRVRYQGPEIKALIIPDTENTWSVILEEPMPDITPGQVCVVYAEEFCLGGGFILP